MAQIGTGTTILTGTANTYSGGTTIAAGTLQIGDGGADGEASPGAIRPRDPHLQPFQQPNLQRRHQRQRRVGSGRERRLDSHGEQHVRRSDDDQRRHVADRQRQQRRVSDQPDDRVSATAPLSAFNHADSLTYGGVMSGGGNLTKIWRGHVNPQRHTGLLCADHRQPRRFADRKRPHAVHHVLRDRQPADAADRRAQRDERLCRSGDLDYRRRSLPEDRQRRIQFDGQQSTRRPSPCPRLDINIEGGTSELQSGYHQTWSANEASLDIGNGDF